MKKSIYYSRVLLLFLLISFTGLFAQSTSGESLSSDTNLPKYQESRRTIQTRVFPINGIFNVASLRDESFLERIDILDINGRLVYTEVLRDSNLGVKINMQNQLQTGIYLVRIQFENGEFRTEKVHIN